MAGAQTGWRGPEDSPHVIRLENGRERICYTGPDAGRLEAEMQRFLAWFGAADQTDPVLRAGLAHLWFLSLRPFAAGNGAMAWALTEVALCRAENSPRLYYGLAESLLEKRDAYFALLQRSQRAGLDVSAWLRWFLELLVQALDRADSLLAPLFGRERVLAHAARYPLSARQKKALEALLDGPQKSLSSSAYAKLTGISQDSALRDINDLLLNKILRQKKGGGRSTAYELAQL